MVHRACGLEAGKFILDCEVHCLSGLQSGAGRDDVYLRGVDAPLRCNYMARLPSPFVAGKSFKDKVRCLLEQFYGLPMKDFGGTTPIRRHECSPEAAPDCQVCYGFGCAGFRGRLTFEHVLPGFTPVSFASAQEIKTENALDRLQGSALPRSVERISRGNVLTTRIIASVRRPEIDNAHSMVNTLLLGLQLLEDDALGGGGSRGSGWIRLTNLRPGLVRFRQEQRETGLGFIQEKRPEDPGFPRDSLAALRKQWLEGIDLKTWRDFFLADEHGPRATTKA